MTVEARELYSSSMDRWYLVREPRSERMLIEREPNARQRARALARAVRA
jgi:hypothetical protein